VVQPARSEMSSRLRYYLFAFLAFVLATEVVVDLQSGKCCSSPAAAFTACLLPARLLCVQFGEARPPVRQRRWLVVVGCAAYRRLGSLWHVHGAN